MFLAILFLIAIFLMGFIYGFFVRDLVYKYKEKKNEHRDAGKSA